MTIQGTTTITEEPLDGEVVSKDYQEGYEAAVIKACEWLNVNLPDQDPAHYNYDMEKMYAEFVEDFKQAMEEKL